MKQILIVLMLLVSSISINAQNYRPIQVGDSLPDILIPKILQWNKKTVRTGDFKGRLLILDFWATTCGTCILAFPEMQRLQKHYGEKIMILPVTSQDASSIQNFWTTSTFIKKNKVSLPSVVEDTLLSKLFPHNSIPHEVWIYKGKVIGITGGEHVDTLNINAVLRGSKPTLPLKYDFYQFDRSKPIFPVGISADSRQRKVNRYTVIGEFNPVLTSEYTGEWGIHRDTLNKSIRMYFVNNYILSPYLQYQKSNRPAAGYATPTGWVQSNSFIWEVKDRSIYRYDMKLGRYWDWIMSNSICFESSWPDNGQSDTAVYRSALQDLNHLLGLYAGWERRKEKVCVIVDMPNTKAKSMVASKQKSAGIDLGAFVTEWNNQEDNVYMFNESKAQLEPGVVFDPSLLGNVSALRSLLRSVGLDLKEEEREVDKFVVREVGYKRQSK